VDYGFVGDVAGSGSINVSALETLLQAGLTPVFAPLTHDTKGSMLNTNADTIAAVLAMALASRHNVQLVYCFEKKGVLLDVENEDSVIAHINSQSYLALKSDGVITAGMVPKLDNAFAALEQGVSQVLICEAEALASLSKGDQFTGTKLQRI